MRNKVVSVQCGVWGVGSGVFQFGMRNEEFGIEWAVGSGKWEVGSLECEGLRVELFNAE